MPEVKPRHVAQVLQTAEFTAAKMEEGDGYKLHHGFVVYKPAGEDTPVTVRYEHGIEKLGKRVKELVPDHKANIAEYAETLNASQYETEEATDEDGFPILHVMAYTGEEIADEPETTRRPGRPSNSTDEERKEKQREYHRLYNLRKKEEAAKLRANPDGTANAPRTSDAPEGGYKIEVGEEYLLIAGHVTIKGKVAEVLAINTERSTAQIKVGNHIVNCRLSSLMPIDAAAKKAVAAAAAKRNGNGGEAKLLSGPALARQQAATAPPRVEPEPEAEADDEAAAEEVADVEA